MPAPDAITEHQSPKGVPSLLAGPLRLGRALVLALVVSVLGSLLANYHDGAIIHLEASQHNAVAPLVIAMLFLFVALVNPLLLRLKPKWGLGSAELGLALALALLATPLARPLASKWVRTVGYTRSLIEARHQGMGPLLTINTFAALPDAAMLDAAESRAFDDGLGTTPGALVAPQRVPWRVWLRPLLFWLPLLVSFVVMSIALAFLLHRQWAHRELVPFPLATLAADAVRRDQGRRLPDIFYNRSFWCGFGLVALVFAINGLHTHLPKMIEIPLKFQFYQLSQQFPFLKNSLEGYSLLRGWIYVAVVVVAVLLPAEISFTAWFSWPLMVCCTYLYYVQTGQKFTGVDNTMVQTGSFLAMALLILYTGRSYYAAILRGALGFKPSKRGKLAADPQEIMVCRCFLLATVTLIAVLVLYGIPLDLALVWTLALLLFFLVVCRLVAEMGIPWTPLGGVGPLPTTISLLGLQTLGARAYALLAAVSTMLIGTSVQLPAVAINAAEIESRLVKRPARLRLALPFATLLLLACIAIAIWMGYGSEGVSNDYPLPDMETVKNASVAVRNVFQHEAADGVAALTTAAPFAARWSAVKMDHRFLPLFAFGMALIFVTGAARLRFPRFPFHPLPLVLLGTWLMSRYFFSFFLGWLIKAAIIKIGGGRLFERTRPFFVGGITGLTVIYSLWILANVLLFRTNGFMFQREWTIILRDIFSG